MAPADQREGDINLSPNRARWDARNVSDATRALLARDEAVFMHQSLSTPCLSAVVRADGSWLEDADGRRYLDFHGNSVHHIGYGHQKVLEAVETQIRELSFAPRRFTCEPAVTLAERLGELVPGGPWKVLFAPGGSEAVEIALKIARLAPVASRRSASGTRSTAQASGRPRSVANRCSVRAGSVLCCPAPSTFRPFPVTGAPTASAFPMGRRILHSATWLVPGRSATSSNMRAMWRLW